MGLVDDDPLTELTEIHQKAIKKMERLGYQVMEEVRFPPYVIDIYVPKLHVAIEVDGPFHKENKDNKRDTFLWEEYNLPVLRLSLKEAANSSHIRQMMKEAVSKYEESAGIRFEDAEDKLPWL